MSFQQSVSCYGGLILGNRSARRLQEKDLPGFPSLPPRAEESSTNFLGWRLTKPGLIFTHFSQIKSHQFSPKVHTESAQWKNRDVIVHSIVCTCCMDAVSKLEASWEACSIFSSLSGEVIGKLAQRKSSQRDLPWPLKRRYLWTRVKLFARKQVQPGFQLVSNLCSHWCLQPRCCCSLSTCGDGDLWYSHPPNAVEPHHQQGRAWMPSFVPVLYCTSLWWLLN
jgi:hypothetical protein